MITSPHDHIIMIDSTISHYKILEKLGEGGMGVVYKAQDTKLDRLVALKFLPHHVAANEEERTRFRTEARAAAALNHRNIAQIYAIEETNDEAFIVMEYIDGEELKSTIASGPLPEDVVRRYAGDLAKGLQAAHAKGIVHRDVKSSNIMVTRDGEIRIMDFGLAKVREGLQLTKAGTTVGTAAYMSPEQARGEEADLRSDIWSYGVVLYEMLIGKLPFGGGYEHAVVYSILNTQPEIPASLPSNLRQVIATCLAKDASDRYQSFDEVLGDLASERAGATTGGSGTGRMKIGLRGVIFLTTALAVIAALTLVLWPTKSTNTIDSIAVLPLENLSGNPDQEYFADGMTDALITDLSKIHALRVISRTSVMQFKGVSKSLPEIARELNVGAVIEGSVMRSGDRVRINASLIDAGTEQSLWADSYEKDLSDVFALQRGIAQKIAERVKVSLTSSEQQYLEIAQKVDPEAYDAYLKGLHANSLYSAGGFVDALHYFDEAIRKDPTLADAYLGIAVACNGMIDIGPLPYGSIYTRGKQAIQKALALEPQSPYAWAVLGQFRYIAEWDWSGAANAFRKALELDDRDPRILYAYAIYMLCTGPMDEAIRLIEEARSRDPFAPDLNSDVGWFYYVAGRYDDAIREYQSNTERYPEYVMSYREISWPYQEKQLFDKALAASQHAYELDPDIINLAYLGIAHAYAGHTQEARRIIKQIEAQKDSVRVPAYELAILHTRLGDTDKAFEWLDYIYRNHQGWPFFVKRDRMFAPIKKDPRYAALLKNIGLEP